MEKCHVKQNLIVFWRFFVPNGEIFLKFPRRVPKKQLNRS